MNPITLHLPDERNTIITIPSISSQILKDNKLLLEKANAKFEELKQYPPLLKGCIKDLPKGAELHIHLLGSIYSDTILKMAIEGGLYFNPTTNLFEKPPYYPFSKGFSVPAKELLTNPTYRNGFFDAMTMRNCYKSDKNPHTHFMCRSYGVIESVIANLNPDKIVDLVAVVRENAIRQKIRWTELMVGLSAIKLLSKTFSDFFKHEDTIGYVIEIDRNQPLDSFKAQVQESVQLIKSSKGKILSYNIVGSEDHLNSQWNFDAQMQIIDEEYKKYPTNNLLHAGELTAQYSSPKYMENRLLDTIEKGHARRIGHGVCLGESKCVKTVLKLMRKNNIAVEVCLSSNDKILGLTGKDHPVHTYVKEKVKVVIGSDDPGVNQEDLNDQFYRLATEHNFSLDRLIEFTRNGLECSLLTGDSIFIEGNTSKFHPLFQGVDCQEWQPSHEAVEYMKNSLRAAEQVSHERDLVAFLSELVDD